MDRLTLTKCLMAALCLVSASASCAPERTPREEFEAELKRMREFRTNANTETVRQGFFKRELVSLMNSSHRVARSISRRCLFATLWSRIGWTGR